VKIQKKSRRGKIRSDTISGTEFSARLSRVKAETLSGSGWISQVRSGPRWVIRLRHFPYPGAIGLAGLGRVTARITGLARVKLS
jgi:hypothetical protein